MGRVRRDTILTVHIHAPSPTSRFARKHVCPDCKKESLFIGVHYEWYGSTQTCLRCGRKWCDGEWMPLGFYRHARRDNKRAAKAAYRRAK